MPQVCEAQGKVPTYAARPHGYYTPQLLPCQERQDSMPQEESTRPTDEEALLTVKEFAATLRMGESTVRGLIKEGKIDVVRIGRLIRIKKAVLHAILERRETHP